MNLTLQKADNIIYYMLIIYAFTSTISIAGSHIAIGLATLTAILRYYKQPIRPAFDGGLIKAVAAFLGAMILSGLFGYHPIVSLEALWSTFYRMVPLILVITFIKDERKISILLTTLAISILVSDIYAIWQGVHGNFRAKAFSNYMIFGGCLLQMIPLLLTLSLHNYNRYLGNRKFFLLVCIISIIALGYNGTRGAWLAVAAAILTYTCLNLARNRRIFIVLLILTLLVGIFAVNIPVIKDKFLSITDLNNQSNAERLLLWQSALQMFNDHKLFGIGSGNFKALYNSRYILPMAKEPGLGHAHNNFLHILAEMGIIGFSCFVYLFGYILIKAYHGYKKKPNEMHMIALLLITISLLVQGLTEYNFDNSAVIRLYWFITGLLLTADNLSLEKKNK